MKRHLLALASCLCLAACGGGGGGPNEADQLPGDGPRELLAAILLWQDIGGSLPGDLTLYVEGGGRIHRRASGRAASGPHGSHHE